MAQHGILKFVANIIENMPADWLKLTTHRLDIYNEEQAKTQFLEHFDAMFSENNFDRDSLTNLPTAYDYIRLGHPLSCILEWTVSKLYNIENQNVISFSSQTAPILAVLRKNLLDGRATTIFYTSSLPSSFNVDIIRQVYNYHFELVKLDSLEEIDHKEASTILIAENDDITYFDTSIEVDFQINISSSYGSIIMASGNENNAYISEIQHVRRRETIAMTPINCLAVLTGLNNQTQDTPEAVERVTNKATVVNTVKEITQAPSDVLVGSSGLSVQYAIMMGLIDYAIEHHPNKAIKFVVPPNCYGGTNDQARRVAACNNNVSIVDLPVDGDNDMVSSLNKVLDQIAEQDAIPYIIAEIPTNPRVEVPDLDELKAALSKKRVTSKGQLAIDPVFILDQTFCPNVHFLGKGKVLSTVRAISYASGSKFPSGGKCTAGYCVGNHLAFGLMDKIGLHLQMCDNEATDLQYALLAEQLPSMNQRIDRAYSNTREFVGYIQEQLPKAKINFVSEELANQGFTPSVFSLDLPTKGNSEEERETYKRKLNHRLIKMMIREIPEESKYCVSYGQLKGCYWTIPATSTQGTTKEGDKDYIARVALAGDLNLAKHKAIFKQFVDSLN